MKTDNINLIFGILMLISGVFILINQNITIIFFGLALLFHPDGLIEEINKSKKNKNKW